MNPNIGLLSKLRSLERKSTLLKSKKKLCTKCQKRKLKKSFLIHLSGRRKGTLHSWCKQCESFRHSVYEKSHAAQRRRSTNKWRINNPEKWEFAKWKGHLKEKFGITPEDYRVVLQYQKGLCAICHKPPKGRRLHVDHSHEDQSFRGLLCNRCNAALERMEAVPDWDLHARAYLSKRSYVYGGTSKYRFTELNYDEDVQREKEMVN